MPPLLINPPLNPRQRIKQMTDTVLYEVFVRASGSGGHQHVGSLRAANDREALLNARDLYTRRSEGVSVWVVRSEAIIASHPDESLFEATSKPYRHPTFYPVPEGVKNL